MSPTSTIAMGDLTALSGIPTDSSATVLEPLPPPHVHHRLPQLLQRLAPSLEREKRRAQAPMSERQPDSTSRKINSKRKP
ncbi:F-box protein [Pyrus ussuriensis x Pyrus communis]|uniref:F-box protein n=1 Tax=Pyrus ussuriensis x Pyrus communis TaxID=2448454 RepID=A0A5N5H3E7_9ROSA|nr:F-box protein [Pyrus ussuriensis x Pyrus communis]